MRGVWEKPGLVKKLNVVWKMRLENELGLVKKNDCRVKEMIKNIPGLNRKEIRVREKLWILRISKLN